MAQATQVNLAGDPLPRVSAEPVESEIQVIEFEIYISGKWRLKVRKDAVKEIFEGTDQSKREESLRGFVQRRIRVKNKDIRLSQGDFDRGVEEMIEALKQG